LAIEGDLRFLSHHDTIRLIERITSRAQIAVKYSQGFNPRPIFSLASPRSVGIATEGDLLVISLNEPLESDKSPELLQRLNEQAPRGLRFLQARPITAKPTPRPRRSFYEIELSPEKLSAVSKKIEQLTNLDLWEIQRQKPSKKRGRSIMTRHINLKPLVEQLKIDGNLLRITLIPQGDLWARPGEVLRLLGLDEQTDLANVIRSEVDYGLGNENLAATA